jgi:hypothetical protein
MVAFSMVITKATVNFLSHRINFWNDDRLPSKSLYMYPGETAADENYISIISLGFAFIHSYIDKLKMRNLMS